METLTTPQTVADLVEVVNTFYMNHEQNPPATPTFDKVARALGVAETCTGNPDTAQQSKEHTPKKGLVVQFYTAAPGYRSERFVMNCYYVATWGGAKYRGHVVLSDVGYHADTPAGFVCFDQSSYSETLPDGCRKLVARIVTDAVIDSGVALADLKTERAEHSRHYEVQSKLYAAVRGVEDAERAEKGAY
jgi:hypothetical protein